METTNPARIGEAQKVLPLRATLNGFIYGDDYRFHQEGQTPGPAAQEPWPVRFTNIFWIELNGRDRHPVFNSRPPRLFQVPMQNLTNRIIDFVQLKRPESAHQASVIAPPQRLAPAVIEGTHGPGLAQERMGIMQQNVNLIKRETGNEHGRSARAANISPASEIQGADYQPQGVLPGGGINHAPRLLKLNKGYNWQDIIYQADTMISPLHQG